MRPSQRPCIFARRFGTLPSEFARISENLPNNAPANPARIRQFRFAQFSNNTHFWQLGMSSRRVQTPKRLFIRGSLLSLCVIVFCTCETRLAWATCGDYLHGQVNSVSDDPVRGLASMPDLVFSRSRKPGHQLPGPVCSGPSCRRDQQVPADPGKAIQVPTFSDAILATIFVAVNIENAGVARPTNVDRLTRSTGRIFRPPRAA